MPTASCFPARRRTSIANGSALSNNPGTQGGSNLNLSSAGGQIGTSFGTTGGSHTITIEISETGWFAPVGNPLTLSASSSGASIAYVAGTNPFAVETVQASYQSFLDNTNALFGTPGSGATGVLSGSASLSSAGTTTAAFNPGTTVVLVPGVTAGNPFSLTSVSTFSFTLGAGSGQDSASISGSTVVSTPVPAGVVLAFTGLPVLGFGAWFRRRRKAD